MPPKKPDRVVSVQKVDNRYRAKYVINGQYKYLYRDSLDVAERDAQKAIQNPSENNVQKTILNTDQKPPETLEELKALIGTTLEDVRAGRVDGSKAAPIVQLAKAQMMLIKQTPKRDTLTELEKLSDNELLNMLAGLISERHKKEDVLQFATRLLNDCNKR